MANGPCSLSNFRVYRLTSCLRFPEIRGCSTSKNGLKDESFDIRHALCVLIYSVLAKYWGVGSNWNFPPETIGTPEQAIPIANEVLDNVREQASERYEEALQAMAS